MDCDLRVDVKWSLEGLRLDVLTRLDV